MKSLHHLIPICTIALCALFMASAAAAHQSAHTGMTQTVTMTRIAPTATVKQVGASGASSASHTAPPMGTIRENDNQIAGQYCIAHWQDSACRGVLALHDEALKLQQKDGGKLSPEHLQELQSKLDAVLADVQSKLDAAQPPSG